MPSNINFETIDTTYPVPGKDNSTQGFRDNYLAIRTALDVAKTELTDLIDKTARRDVDNNFTGVELQNAVLREVSSSVLKSTEPLTLDQAVSWADGDLHSYIIGSNISLVFQGWPETDRYAKIRVVLTGADSTVHTVTLNSLGVESLRLVAGTTATVATPSDPEQAVIVEAWTFDGGDTVYVNFVGAFENEFTLDTINAIGDVAIATPSNGQVLKYNAGLGRWTNQADNATVAALNDVLNVDAPAPTDKQVLQWNNTASRWRAVTLVSEYKGSADVPDASALSLTPSAHYFDCIGTESATLAAGTDGQTKTLVKTNSTGNMNITVTNAGWKTSGTGIITFTAIGSGCTLQYINSKWYVVGNNGATVS